MVSCEDERDQEESARYRPSTIGRSPGAYLLTEHPASLHKGGAGRIGGIPHRPMRPAIAPSSVAGLRDDDVARLQPLLALHHREFHPLSLFERPVAFAPDGAEVHEYVITAVAGDETVAFGVVEPLDGPCLTLRHRQSPAFAAGGFIEAERSSGSRDRSSSKTAARYPTTSALYHSKTRLSSGTTAIPPEKRGQATFLRSAQQQPFSTMKERRGKVACPLSMAARRGRGGRREAAG